MKLFVCARRAAFLLAASTALAPFGADAQSPQASVATTPIATSAGPRPHFGTWGVDLSVRDLSVRPGDDFQKYASGKWLATTDIPADKPEVGSFYELLDLTQGQLRDLVTRAPANSAYGALYQSMMNEGRLEQLGLAPLRNDLATIAAIKTKADMARHMGTTQGAFGSSLFGWWLQPDTADASMNALNLSQAGLGMPNRD